MKTTLYKYLSYIYPIGIDVTSSVYNSVIEIQWQNGVKVLNSDKANFSYGSLHQVFQQGFKHYNLPNADVQSILILGFGGGSVYSILRNELRYKGKITGVELDDKIIKAAHQHFNIPSNNKQFTLINTNALTFVSNNKSAYDLIVVDVFNDLLIPKSFLTTKFLQQLNELLTSKGKILYNVISQKNTLIKAIEDNEMNYKTTSINYYGVTNQIIKINHTKK